MINIIVFAVVLSILALDVLYIRKEKKKGTKCIGCPNGGSCARACSCVSEAKNILN